MGKHAQLAPSAAHRWIECPGSVALCASLPPEPESIYAAEGTFAHEIAAQCLRSGVDAETFAGQKSASGHFYVTDEMVAAVQLYLNAVRGTLEFEGGDLQVEETVHLRADDVWGTADAVITDKGTLHVFDFKYGEGVYVDVDNNPQLMIYAAAALWERNQLTPTNRTDVYVHVVQPRHYASESKWRTQKLTAKELLQWTASVLDPAADAASRPDAPLAAGDHCKFCTAKAVCPALQEHVMEHARAAFAPARTLPDANNMTAEQIADVLSAAPLIESWIHAVRQHAYDRACNHEDIPGYKLVAKYGHRVWRDETEAKRVLKLYGVDPLQTKLVSPAEAERRLKADKAAVKDLAFTPATGSVLVPESDKRPQINSTAAFKALPDNPEGDI